MNIAFDVDGVCADLLEVWIERYNKDYDDLLCASEVSEWDLSCVVKMECGKKIFEYLNDPYLYDNVHPITESLETVQKLRHLGHRVLFVTSTNVYQYAAKLLWLERWGFLELQYGTSSRDYVPIQDKTLVRAEILVDDALHNVSTFPGLGILYAAGHNRDAHWNPRIHSFDELFPLIDEKEKSCA